MFAKGRLSGPQALFCVGTSCEEVPSQHEESEEYLIKEQQKKKKVNSFEPTKLQSIKNKKTIGEERKLLVI